MLLGITTAPRPQGASYFAATIESAYAAGFDDFHIFAEPDSILPHFPARSHLSITRNGLRLGNYGNWLSMARSLHRLAGDDEIIVTCEDDVLFSPNTAKKTEEIMAGLPKEDFGFLSLYTSAIYQRAIPEGVHHYSSRSLWGACCLAWTKESLWAVITHPFFLKWRGLESNPPPIGHPDICHVDTAIGETIVKLKRKSLQTKPCYCQHVGEISSLRKVKLTPERQASHFATE